MPVNMHQPQVHKNMGMADLQSDELMMNWVFFWDMISPTEKNFEVTCEKWMRESKTIF